MLSANLGANMLRSRGHSFHGIGILHRAEKLFSRLHPFTTHEVQVKHPGSQWQPAAKKLAATRQTRTYTEVGACGLTGMASTKTTKRRDAEETNAAAQLRGRPGVEIRHKLSKYASNRPLLSS